MTEDKLDPMEEAFLSAFKLLARKIRLRRSEKLSTLPTHLHHYTTVDGVLGILTDGCLHASAAYYLNDSSEIDYGCKLFTSVLQDWLIGSKNGSDGQLIPNSIPDVLLRVKEGFATPESFERQLSQVYVTCFCEDENLLSQWRAYGQNGGYSIAFKSEKLAHGLSVRNGRHSVALSRVVYQDAEQTSLLKRFVADVVEALRETPIDHLTTTDKENFTNIFSRQLFTMALTEITRFKHHAFKDEKEWRLVIRPSIGPESPVQTEEMKFKPSRGILTPYLELRPRDESLLPIESIRYGPTLEKRQAKNSLAFLLSQQGYNDVQLHGAEIPVRF